MPNYCFYSMKIKGTKKSCEEWLYKMRYYNHNNHFYRIFEADIIDEGGYENDYYMVISGNCAWSLESCCRGSGYAESDLFAINSKELRIIMEAYSEEPGCCFQEHYVYKKGECEVDECVEWKEIYWDEDEYSFEEWKEKFNIPDEVTEDYLYENYYTTGGFEEWNFEI